MFSRLIQYWNEKEKNEYNPWYNMYSVHVDVFDSIFVEK